jgi:hypothetical protein
MMQHHCHGHLSDNRVVRRCPHHQLHQRQFRRPIVGTNKTVSVSGIAMSGADAANYTANTSASTTANIIAASLTPVVSINNKVL